MKSLTISLVIAFSSFVAPTFAETEKAVVTYGAPTQAQVGLYEEGMRAYRSGDCPRAKKLLGEFQRKNDVKLTEYKDFNDLIDRAIKDCQEIYSPGSQLFQTGGESVEKRHQGRIN